MHSFEGGVHPLQFGYCLRVWQYPFEGKGALFFKGFECTLYSLDTA